MTAITAKDIKYAALATRTSQCPLNPQWSRGSWIGRGCPTYNHHNGKLYIIIKYFVSELTNFADSMGPRERVCQFVFQYTMRTCSCHIPYHISYIPYPISQIISFQPPITDTQSPGQDVNFKQILFTHFSGHSGKHSGSPDRVVWLFS